MFKSDINLKANSSKIMVNHEPLKKKSKVDYTLSSLIFQLWQAISQWISGLESRIRTTLDSNYSTVHPHLQKKNQFRPPSPWSAFSQIPSLMLNYVLQKFLFLCEWAWEWINGLPLPKTSTSTFHTNGTTLIRNFITGSGATNESDFPIRNRQCERGLNEKNRQEVAFHPFLVPVLHLIFFPPHLRFFFFISSTPLSNFSHLPVPTFFIKGKFFCLYLVFLYEMVLPVWGDRGVL